MACAFDVALRGRRSSTEQVPSVARVTVRAAHHRPPCGGLPFPERSEGATGRRPGKPEVCVLRPLNPKNKPGPSLSRERPSRSGTTCRSAASGSTRLITAPPLTLRRRLPCSRRATPGSRIAASDVSVVEPPRVHARPKRPARASLPPAPSAGSSMARRRATPRAPGRTARDQRHAACPVGWGRSLPTSRSGLDSVVRSSAPQCRRRLWGPGHARKPRVAPAFGGRRNARLRNAHQPVCTKKYEIRRQRPFSRRGRIRAGISRRAKPGARASHPPGP